MTRRFATAPSATIKTGKYETMADKTSGSHGWHDRNHIFTTVMSQGSE